uniref:Zn(2)-C6 fungal-type domain-containing protein n=1 Tax=Ganoderma boninense TaxID=34458 RepID=A0A5K1K6L4_9APHY|nr:Zn(2)-C6 fungal-type domain-containing protein [Ganoderma boninense]
MATSTVLRVNLALTCVESALYGIFFLLATTSLSVLVARRWRSPNGTSTLSVGGTLLRSPLVIATLLLFITVSGSMDYEGGRNMTGYYLLVESPPQVVAAAFVVASVIVGDIILTYRVWIVWDKKLATIIFPALCTCAYIVVVQLFAVFKPEESIFVSASKRRVITTAALTLSTNMYGTGCIAYRIWTTNRAMKHERAAGPGMGLSEALVIFVESAALYTSWTFFFLVSYIASSPLEAFAFHCIPAATGISFMLIIVRVGLGFSWAEIAGSQLAVSVGGLGGIAGPTVTTRGQTDLAAAYPLAMIVSVTQTVEREVTDFALPRVGSKGDSDSDTVGETV